MVTTRKVAPESSTPRGLGNRDIGDRDATLVSPDSDVPRPMIGVSDVNQQLAIDRNLYRVPGHNNRVGMPCCG